MSMADRVEEELRRLLEHPTEALDVEVKQWIDPTSPEGIGKITKACLALRNNDGGHLIIGFTDSGEPDTSNVPSQVRDTFHPDVVQGIVGKYASTPFSVEVHYVRRGEEGQEYPILTIPSGVETPNCRLNQLSEVLQIQACEMPTNKRSDVGLPVVQANPHKSVPISFARYGTAHSVV